MEKSTEKYIGMLLDGRYEILELIGTGGMANVYKALCHRLNRYDAVKIMRDDTAADENFRKRFRDESKAVAMLSHPNIVSVYDVSHNDDIEYIVMELIDGINLKQYLKMKGALSSDEVLDFSIQIARALAHAHSKGIIHRDIKPQNVMLLKDGLIKVADFGIAALPTENEEFSNETVGSVHYIAPEQARGAAPDARSDVYSLGIVMYEMITGRLPYVGKSDVEVAVKHMNTDAIPPSEIVSDIPAELERVCLKAMSTDIADRYQTADELLSDLENYRNSLITAASNDSGVASSVIETEDYEEAVDRKKRKHEKRKNKSSISSGIIAVLIFIMIVLVFTIGYFMKDMFSNPEQIEVPDFVGRYYEDVINDSDYNEQYNFTVTFKADDEHESGIIIEQTPKEGVKKIISDKDTKIDVELVCSGEVVPEDNVKQAEVPDVTNKELSEAVATLKNSGFSYVVNEVSSQSITKGCVVNTSPAAGEEASTDTQIIITVSTGPQTVTTNVPKLIGLSKNAAIEKIEANNLSVGEITKVDSEYEEGTVIWQSIDSGETVEEHTTIDIQISRGNADGGA